MKTPTPRQRQLESQAFVECPRASIRLVRVVGMKSHDKKKLDLLLPQLTLYGVHERSPDSAPMKVRIDPQPIDLSARRAMLFDQQQSIRLSVDSCDPTFQDLRLQGVVAVRLRLRKPLGQTLRQGLQDPAPELRIVLGSNLNGHVRV